jgi:hypothetical protein
MGFPQTVKTISPAEQSATWIIRMLCLLGVFVTSCLVLLGFGWPSAIFTPIAIIGLPSPILFLIAIFLPSLVKNHRFLRYYLIGCSAASLFCFLFEYWWVHHINGVFDIHA